MTVAELIRLLQTVPQDCRVFASTGDEFGNEILPETGVSICQVEVEGEGKRSVVYIGNGDGPVSTRI